MNANERKSGKHDCRESASAVRATRDRPYRFAGSGLSNVFLSGVRYLVCTKSGKQSAEIPSLRELMTVIARALVEKDSPLTGPEIRFLRKRLGKKAADFAAVIGVTPEHCSRWENGKVLPSAMADSLIRLYYALESGDKALLDRLRAGLADILGRRAPRPKAEAISARIRNNAWEAQKQAA